MVLYKDVKFQWGTVPLTGKTGARYWEGKRMVYYDTATAIGNLVEDDTNLDAGQRFLYVGLSR